MTSQISVAAAPYSTRGLQQDSDAFEGGGASLRESFYTRTGGAPTERAPTEGSGPTSPRVWRPAVQTMKREHTGEVRAAAPSELQTLVLRVLKDSYEGGIKLGISTNAIRKHCSSEVSKLQLNQLLYALKDSEQVDFTPGSPPLWRHKPPLGASAAAASVTPAADDEPLVLVLIDLGNTHCILQNLLPYAEQDLMEVRAYADLAFAGFGVKPSLNCKNVMVFHAKTADKNSADLQLIWDLSRYVQKLGIEQPTRSLQVYVGTKDLQFQSLKSLVEDNPLHKLTFCTDWDTLRMHIE
jgi:hypothetical protein